MKIPTHDTDAIKAIHQATEDLLEEMLTESMCDAGYAVYKRIKDARRGAWKSVCEDEDEAEYAATSSGHSNAQGWTSEDRQVQA